ncbi:MAG: hypothetical protein WC845_00105 [Candidatus Staskawiczbacteria bacterium]|jgi:hypothetical protein
MISNRRIAASFRDPSGFLFQREGLVYRQINMVYKDNYDYLMSSGLYSDLVNNKLLIPHEETKTEDPLPDGVYKIIAPRLVHFISYPYEWCFSQLKKAALVTLEIQKKSLEFGMSLRDCSAYNIQFIGANAVFIDTLSFKKYQEGQLWPAYKQFCQHFLGPLALMSYTDIRLNKLSQVYIDGIPLDLTSRLLPLKTCFRFPLFSHIHLHAKGQTHFADKNLDISKRKISRLALNGLIDNLYSAVEKLNWQPDKTEWADYYRDTNYSQESLNHKKNLWQNF